MHPDEHLIDTPLVRRLLGEQCPQWDGLPIRPVTPSGTDHAVFRLGNELSVRFPRVDGRVTPGSKELTWLPQLASVLPVDIPIPVGEGRPAHGYPYFWEVHTWVAGDSTSVEALDSYRAVRDLCAFIKTLQRVDPGGAPVGRGIPLAERDIYVRRWLKQLGDDARVTSEWERALAAPVWEAPPVWHHGDLDARNWLVRDGRIRGVIDWSCMGVGDPACDLMVAWKLHSVAAYRAFREEIPADDATWERARGWVISQAVGILAYYTPQNNPILFHEAEHWLELALSDETH